MKRVLALDTTSTHCSIAVLEGEAVITEFNFFVSAELSEILVDRIDYAVSSSGTAISGIDVVGVTNGPGFFTGIRVGLSILKGILFRRDVPVVPVSSLQAAAAKVRADNAYIVPVIDARRGEIYCASYFVRDGVMSEVLPPALFRADEIGRQVRVNGSTYFTGNGLSAYSELIKEKFPGSALISGSPFLAAETGLIALKEYEAGNYLKSASELEPLYIRIPDAEKNHASGQD